MALDFKPQPVEAMRRRYLAALRHEYDVARVLEGLEPRAGTHRRHVFDFHDGIRLILSRDRMNKLQLLHASASLQPTWPFYVELEKQIAKLKDKKELAIETLGKRLFDRALTRFRSISRDNRRPADAQFSPGQGKVDIFWPWQEIRRCPNCGGKLAQHAPGVYYCGNCDGLLDDDPEEGGDFYRDPVHNAIKREERGK